jgi:hypothetical protein
MHGVHGSMAVVLHIVRRINLVLNLSKSRQTFLGDQGQTCLKYLIWNWRIKTKLYMEYYLTSMQKAGYCAL